MPPPLLVTTGDPAGIGPDILLQLAAKPHSLNLTAIGDRNLLQARANLLNLNLTITDPTPTPTPIPVANHLPTIHRPSPEKLTIGTPHPRNAAHIIDCINTATDLCLAKKYAALITCPVNKATINQAGIPFQGHTEHIAARCHAKTPVMLLLSEKIPLRIALLTTHIPLAQVPAQITRPRLTRVLQTLIRDLPRLLRIPNPRIAVCGLNPHAGENGILGHEETQTITPALNALRAKLPDTVQIHGPLPADTLFTPAALKNHHAILAMYHDQALPVIKHADFQTAVNLTLGLPIIRTSPDHGTAAALAGTTQADPSSLQAALHLAAQIATPTTPQ